MADVRHAEGMVKGQARPVAAKAVLLADKRCAMCGSPHASLGLGPTTLKRPLERTQQTVWYCADGCFDVTAPGQAAVFARLEEAHSDAA